MIFNESDPAKNYQLLVSNYSNRVDDVLQSLGEEFVEYIQQERLQSVRHIPQVIISVAKHQAQRVHVIDPVITMLSCVYDIQGIVKE